MIYRSLHDPVQRRQGLRHLRRADPRLAILVREQGDLWRPRRTSLFAVLCSIVVGQQLSTHVARTIRARLRRACGGRITATAIASLDDDTLRACGLSRQKTASLQALSEEVLTCRLRLASFARRDDTAVIARLIEIRGLGPWSAEMFLLSGLGRPDVLAAGDLGLREGARRLAGLTRRPSPDELRQLAEPWRPYRSLAGMYLWALLGQYG